MLQIRRGVPETNSSASHSMCIRGDVDSSCVNVDEVIDLLNGRGVWKIRDNNWERWPVRLVETFAEKVLYVLGLISKTRVSENVPTVKELAELVKKYVPEFTAFDTDGDSSYGYTQNYGFFAWLKNNNISLEEFLTNKKYFIIADGDEYNIFSTMADCEIIKNDVNITSTYS